MKPTKITALIAAFGVAVSLAACSSDEEPTTGNGESTTRATGSTEAGDTGSSDTATPAPEQPTAADLNEVLARATDSSLPMEERVSSVQGGETAPELFDTMTISKEESGADFQVVDPVLPGYAPNSVLATVNFTQPDQATQLAENVEFIYEDGAWKLSQSWACTLITNTVTPEQVPAMCQAGGDAGPVEEAPAEAPAEQPAEAPAEQPAEGAPAQ
ncbi:hypothetical protein QP027_07415 [Corynebacterium breve]|uniref:Low molecular weight antigen MTB12-like C-terminal domain-containing protein n=1 Tax=Corynebacterium breve TaxID=3049799 RepID=A0ABY8VBG0_9CORY|nr:hypothetical protein [Corynebacterium breve]WIM66961.1 hypothetical protein QP027_07415 [Corynebacterium breve]